MTASTVLFERQGNLAFVTLNRPERANSITHSMLAELRAIEEELKNDRQTQIVVVTGAGRHFCAGVDLEEALNVAPVANGSRIGFDKLPQIVIAAINGSALGGGCEIALACDYRIASQSAVLGLPEVQFGELPLLGGTARLARIIGASAAKKMILTGEPVSAVDAAKLRLVDEVCEPADLVARASDLATRISINASYAVRTGKRLIDESLNGTLEEALEREQTEVLAMATDAERREARRAAAERSPVYKKLFGE